MRFKALCFGLILLAVGLVGSQTTSQPMPADEGIKVSAFADHATVPLNRTVQVTIRLEWYGDLDRYEITDLESLTAQNFEVISNSSANKVAVVNGRNVSVHDFQYTLRPSSLGMGYVNGLTVKYTDALTQKPYRLWTNRVEIKVLDPVAEPGSYGWLLYLLAGLAILAAAGYLLWRLQQKKARQRQAALEEAQRQRPMEERYLQTLSSQIDLARGDLDIGEALSALSKLVRKYWAEKFGVPGLEATTEEFLAALQAQRLDERMVREVAEVLQVADVAKFSGTGADRPTLERLYTLFEFQLKSFLNQPQSITREDR